MTLYYNTCRTRLVLRLRDGMTAGMSPRGTLDLSPAQDRSADILAKLKKGMLKVLPSAAIVAPAAVIEAPMPTPAPEVPQDLVTTPSREVAEEVGYSVELELPTTGEETRSDEDRSQNKRRFDRKHRS